ncbi:hypothetical protein B0T19DRAFT_399797 [Cercophora scortea]|uniref:Uncharacterized protein n=1 Tax=Cercophora scortea TaxID=314031 RepID=A0AAE0IZI4_9PEZI|nr:hypothetical protein B0T19DRAFT_399797 [Cercophora scortea]
MDINFDDAIAILMEELGLPDKTSTTYVVECFKEYAEHLLEPSPNAVEPPFAHVESVARYYEGTSEWCVEYERYDISKEEKECWSWSMHAARFVHFTTGHPNLFARTVPTRDTVKQMWQILCLLRSLWKMKDQPVDEADADAVAKRAAREKMRKVLVIAMDANVSCLRPIIHLAWDLHYIMVNSCTSSHMNSCVLSLGLLVWNFLKPSLKGINANNLLVKRLRAIYPVVSLM